MSKDFEDYTKEEKLETHKETRWYHVGRASMAEQISFMFINRAGEFYKSNRDSTAELHRNLASEMTEMERHERLQQIEVEKLIEELDEED